MSAENFTRLLRSSDAGICFLDLNDQGINLRRPVFLMDETKISLSRFCDDLKEKEENNPNFWERLFILRGYLGT